MSSTKRGQRGGENTDTFPTPPWVTRRLVEQRYRQGLQIRGDVLEPCAGDGSIISTIASSHYPQIRDGALRFHAVELRSFEECRPTFGLGGDLVTHDYGQDFLTWARTTDRRFDTVITNPPFKDALAFAEVALSLLKSGGQLILLLRINWLGGKERHAFLQTMTPDLLVLPNRPSFTPDGKTDSIEYAWWTFPGNGRWTLSDLTSITDRKEGREDPAPKKKLSKTTRKARPAVTLFPITQPTGFANVEGHVELQLTAVEETAETIAVMTQIAPVDPSVLLAKLLGGTK